MKLFFFGRPMQCPGRGFTARDDPGDVVKISGADFMLMFGRGVTVSFGGELRLRGKRAVAGARGDGRPVE